MCDSKEGFNILLFKDMLRSTIESKEYEGKKFQFLERWCVEIEDNIAKGMKKTSTKPEKMSTPISRELVPFTPNKNKVQNRFVISSDETSDENLPGTSGMIRKPINQSEGSNMTVDSPNKNEIVIISSEEKTSDEGKSEIIERENEFLTYESTDDEEEEDNVKKFILQYSSNDSE